MLAAYGAHRVGVDDAEDVERDAPGVLGKWLDLSVTRDWCWSGSGDSVVAGRQRNIARAIWALTVAQLVLFKGETSRGSQESGPGQLPTITIKIGAVLLKKPRSSKTEIDVD